MTQMGTILVNVSFQAKHNIHSAVTGWTSLWWYQLALLIDYAVQTNSISFSSCSACQLLRVIEVPKCQWICLFFLIVLLIYFMHFQRLLLGGNKPRVVCILMENWVLQTMSLLSLISFIATKIIFFSNQYIIASFVLQYNITYIRKYIFFNGGTEQTWQRLAHKAQNVCYLIFYKHSLLTYW